MLLVHPETVIKNIYLPVGRITLVHIECVFKSANIFFCCFEKKSGDGLPHKNAFLCLIINGVCYKEHGKGHKYRKGF